MTIGYDKLLSLASSALPLGRTIFWNSLLTWRAASMTRDTAVAEMARRWMS